MKVSGTFDVECSSWDRFAVAATFSPRDGGTKIHRSPSALLDHLLRVPGSTWYAHAGGVYDFLLVAEELRRRQIPCTIDLAGARISRLVGGGIVLRDSYPLVPLPLDVAADLAGERAPKLTLACTCGEGCGGYCAIRPDDPRVEVSDYCAADARVLWRVLEAVAAWSDRLGLTLRGTLGGTAYATARDTLGIPDVEMHPTTWRTVRAAYHGGRVTIVRPRAAGPGAHWDLSSSYPAALARASLPIGEHRHDADDDALDALVDERPGVYGCRVRVPDDSFLPPLPVRQGGRMRFPIGPVDGAWALPELRAATSRGCTIERVHWSVTWSQEATIFRDLIRAWGAARTRAGKGSAEGQLTRLLMNSLPGKFAEGPERRSARLYPTEIRYCRGRAPCSALRCSGACGAWEQLDQWGVAWGVPFYRPAPSAHIQWAAYTTSIAREAWLVGAETQGTDLVYGDTDSVWTVARHAPGKIGRMPGAWEYKHGWSEWECVAPRQYRFLDEDADPHVRTAGARITDQDWRAGKATHTRGVLSFSEAARSIGDRGLFQRRAQQWTLPSRAHETGLYGDRLLDATLGVTIPIPYGYEKEARRA